MKKIYAITLAIYVSCLHIIAQNQATPQGFYSFTLENGLQVFIQEDFTVPTVRVEYISKAGTGRQTQETTGFYQLYSRLFWKNDVANMQEYDRIGAGEFTHHVGFSQSRYSFIVPSSRFEDSMYLLSQSLKHVRFSDSNIASEYSTLKQEVTAWSSSVPGFINSSIDARVFSKEPWTKDSGVYPALFANNTVESVRHTLSTISDTWYVPDQSALFISGPLSSNTILSLVRENFESWISSYVIGNTSDAQYSSSAIETEHSTNKFFVLVSNDFSKDYIQSVIQYTAPGLGATDKYSAVSWAAADIMQTKLIEAGMSNTNTSFIADASDSRIIIQTLFDATSITENTDLSLMVPGFANIVKSTAQTITNNDLDDSKQRSLLYRNDAYTGANNFMEAVATNWAYGGVDYFFKWPETVQEVTLHDIKSSFNDPWIFVLLHSELYAKNKDNLENFGYTTITRATGSWYSTPITASTLDTYKTNTITPEESIHEYTEFTKSLIEDYTLSSGIPVVTQQVPATPWVSLLLSFDGGEVLYGENKRGTEQIAITNLKNTIEREFSNLYLSGELRTVPTVENDTDIYSSYISVVCLEEDLPQVLDTTSSIIQKAHISIAAADELFISTAYNWNIQSGSLEYQLYAAAMETLFGGTSVQGLYNANTELLLQADYNDIKIATELLYDPNRISLVLTGNITATTKNELENSFGKRNFYPVEKQFKVMLIEEQQPVFSPFEQIVRLRHTFLTDIPANLAGERPTKLIPTTDFSDPAQLYFDIPLTGQSDYIHFVALLYEIADLLTERFSEMRNPPAQSVTVVPGSGKFPISSLRFSKTKSREGLKNLVQDTFNALLLDLQNKDSNVTEKVKSRYTRLLSLDVTTLTDRSHLIQQGINEYNNPSLYVEKFEIIENASVEDFYNTFYSFLAEGEFFWLFSADTAR